MSITRGKDNVFEDLGFDAEEAANLKIRADLMLDIRQYIQDQGWLACPVRDRSESCLVRQSKHGMD